MSVFDILKNNRGRDDVGVYMSYTTYETYLRQAQQEKVDEIIKLLEEMPWQIYSGVATSGKILDSVTTPKVLLRDDVIALIKEENK